MELGKSTKLRLKMATKNPEPLNNVVGILFIMLGVGFIAALLGYYVATIPFEEAVQNCTEQLINGTSLGIEYTIASLTSEAIQCNTIPINYSGYSYNLIAVECLDLNKTEVK